MRTPTQRLNHVRFQKEWAIISAMRDLDQNHGQILQPSRVYRPPKETVQHQVNDTKFEMRSPPSSVKRPVSRCSTRPLQATLTMPRVRDTCSSLMRCWILRTPSSLAKPNVTLALARAQHSHMLRNEAVQQVSQDDAHALHTTPVHRARREVCVHFGVVLGHMCG